MGALEGLGLKLAWKDEFGRILDNMNEGEKRLLIDDIGHVELEGTLRVGWDTTDKILFYFYNSIVGKFARRYTLSNDDHGNVVMRLRLEGIFAYFFLKRIYWDILDETIRGKSEQGIRSYNSSKEHIAKAREAMRKIGNGKRKNKVLMSDEVVTSCSNWYRKYIMKSDNEKEKRINNLFGKRRKKNKSK